MEVVNQSMNVVLPPNTMPGDGLNNNNNLSSAVNGNEGGNACLGSNSQQGSCALGQYSYFSSSNSSNNNTLETLEEVPEDSSETTEVIVSNVNIQKRHRLANAKHDDGEEVAAEGAHFDAHESATKKKEEEKILDGKAEADDRQEPLLTVDKTTWSDHSSSSKGSGGGGGGHQHRVKFTEELPSQSGNYRRMTTTTSTAATTMTAVALSQEPPQEGQEGAESTRTPVITISEEFPTKEDRAFRTKIDGSYEGWDNPFRPEGEISNDADELLRLWREGKLSKDAEDCGIGSSQMAAEPLIANETNAMPQHNGKNGHKNGCRTFEVKRETVSTTPAASSPKTVILDGGSSPKKKAKGCCSLM